MSKFERPTPIRKPGRQSPFVTVVDTALLIAVQNALAGVAMRLDDPEGDVPFPPLSQPELPEYLKALSGWVADDLSRRSF